jgi:hypothetical protein
MAWSWSGGRRRLVQVVNVVEVAAIGDEIQIDEVAGLDGLQRLNDESGGVLALAGGAIQKIEQNQGPRRQSLVVPALE